MFNGIKQRLSGANKVTVLFAIASAWPVIGFLPSIPSVLVYAITLAYAAYCLGKMTSMDGLCLSLLLYIPIELLLAQPNSVFHSWSRYVFFAALLINVSPFLQSIALRQQRELLFDLMMYVCVFIGVGSFFARFLGINFMTSHYVDSISQVGTFGGLTTQSMTLGPIAGIAACYLSSKAMTSKCLIDWIWAVLSLFSVLFSASRSALFAALTGVIVTLFCQSGSTSRFLRICIVSLVVIASTFSLWEGALSGVIEKNGSSSSLSFDSRQELWEDRIDDFKSSPIWGVGFCATVIKGSIGVDMATGRIESGSSWIIVFSMLGIIGACILIPLFVKAFKAAYKQKTNYCSVICGILALFFIHMFAEGYVFAGGSFLAFMLWLSVGVAMDSRFEIE